MLSLRAPSMASLARLAASEQDGAPTYDAVGATLTGAQPAGYRHDRWEIDLGPAVGDRFQRCADAVMTWQVQLRSGFVVVPDDRIVEGATHALAIRLPVGFARASARIVYVLDEEDRAGFAYGTLPAHPEEGEEAFVVHRRNGRVGFEVVAFSRPRHPLARAGYPVTRALQRRTNRGYLDVMRTVAGIAEPGS